MARQARVYIPNTAQLVQVRGNNNAPVFFQPEDYAQWQSIARTIAPVAAGLLTHHPARHRLLLCDDLRHRRRARSLRRVRR